MPKRNISIVDYSSNEVPPDYKCDNCGALGCKLWRESQTFADITKLLCVDCAGEDQNKNVSTVKSDGKYTTRHGDRTDQIGFYVPAIPVEGMNSYWGYTSIPKAGCKWWDSLPLRRKKE